MSGKDEERRNHQHAQALISALVGAGVRDAVVSPGSRNTPIVLALHALAAAGHPITMHSILDERSAAFFALGLSRITGVPTLLSCTSGSAGAHYLPAIIEAAHSNVPLIAITADRPPELQERGAPQTVTQVGMYGPHVRWSFDLSTPAERAGVQWLRGIAAQAVDAAMGTRPGPVHLNAPFRKPLWLAANTTEPPGPQAHPHRILRGPATLHDTDLQTLATRLGNAKRGCIVWGPQPDERTAAAAVAHLAAHLGWPILTDPVSPLRWSQSTAATVITTHDAFLRDPDTAHQLQADLVLRLGGTPSSKPLSQWLASATDVVSLDATGAWRDPEHRVSTVIAADPTWVCQALPSVVPSPSSDSGWARLWAEHESHAAAALAQTCADGWWSGAIIQDLIAQLPAGTLLHVGSSMPIRDLDAFGRGASDIRVTANRGANGIDGTIATTLGTAAAWSAGPVVGLMGDLTFLHDQGSLMLARGGSQTRVLVVLDNAGGGIFDHLPIAKHADAYEAWFRTPQQADIPALCAAASIPCVTAQDRVTLSEGIADALQRAGTTVVHATFDSATDLALHQAAWQATRSAT